MNELEKYFADITKLCSTHKVKSLYAFGSVLTDKFNDNSDIDDNKIKEGQVGLRK